MAPDPILARMLRARMRSSSESSLSKKQRPPPLKGLQGSCGAYTAGIIVLGLLVYCGIEVLSQQLQNRQGLLTPSGRALMKHLPTITAPSSISMATQLKAAEALDPEVMAHALPRGKSFDPAFKNPCWHAADDQLRCLPYVYIMGSFQAGVVTLYHKLSEHPDVITNDYSRYQFWAEDYKSMNDFVNKHSSGKTLKDIKAQPSKKVILDGSASTFAFYWSAGLRTHRALQAHVVTCYKQCAEANKQQADRNKCMDEKCYGPAYQADLKVAQGLGIPHDHMHLPLLVSAAYGVKAPPKMIVIFRHPVQRVHCAYWQYSHYQNKYGKAAEGFLAYVEEQVAVVKSCAARFTGKPGGPTGTPMTAAQAERHCVLFFEILGSKEEQLFFHADQFFRGMYAIFLEVWLRYVPRENVLVLKAEEYFADQRATMDQVLGFLGLEKPSDNKALDKIYEAGQPSECTKSAPRMLPKAMDLLLDLYRPYNEELAKIMNDPTWLDYNKPPPL